MKLENRMVTILQSLLFGIPGLLWPCPFQPHGTQYTHPAPFLKNLRYPACYLLSSSPTFYEYWGYRGEKSGVGDREPFKSS